MSKILVAEISGKRPGDEKNRPTEKYEINYDKVIISNNSDGYITKWPIINVPDDYVEWYKSKFKTSDNAWYAPMNRSYAIKYAREHGYDYLIQLDDNIINLEIAYILKDKNGIATKFRCNNRPKMMDGFIEMLVCVLENTNASMAGCGMTGTGEVESYILRERYCYSLFALDLSTCADYFHGNFEDDIEYRLKLAEMGQPAVMVTPLRYGKTGQKSSKDESGNRAAYTAAGLKRGEHMRVLHGDIYTCGYAKKTASTLAKDNGEKCFKHKIKPFKLGVLVKNYDAIEQKLLELFSRYAVKRNDSYRIKEKKVKV